MKKSLISSAILLAFSASLVGCGGSSSKEEFASPPAPSTPAPQVETQQPAFVATEQVMPEPEKVPTPRLPEERPIGHEKVDSMRIETLGNGNIRAYTGPDYTTMGTVHVPEDAAVSDVAIPLGTTTTGNYGP